MMAEVAKLGSEELSDNRREGDTEFLIIDPSNFLFINSVSRILSIKIYSNYKYSTVHSPARKC